MIPDHGWKVKPPSALVFGVRTPKSALRRGRWGRLLKPRLETPRGATKAACAAWVSRHVYSPCRQLPANPREDISAQHPPAAGCRLPAAPQMRSKRSTDCTK